MNSRKEFEAALAREESLDALNPNVYVPRSELIESMKAACRLFDEVYYEGEEAARMAHEHELDLIREEAYDEGFEDGLITGEESKDA